MRYALAALFLLLVVTPKVQGQDLQTERQVALDQDGRVLEVGPDLRKGLDLFPDVTGFLSARLFQVGDSTYVLEVAVRRGSQLERQRTPMSEAEVKALREDITRRLEARRPELALNQEGRGWLIFQQTLLGIGFYGWAVPVALQIDDARAGVATYLLVSASAFYVPYRLTRNIPVTHPHRRMASYGATRGALYGFFLREALLGEEDETSENGVGLAALGSMGGSFLGFKAADWMGLTTRGDAELVALLGDFGLGYGFSIARAADMFDDDRDDSEDGVMLGGSALGLAAGAWLSHREHYTRGDVHLLRSIGLLGAHAATPIVCLCLPDDADSDKKERAYVGGMALGSLAGLVGGNFFLEDQDFDLGPSMIVSAGQIAGGALALGLTFLADRNENFGAGPYLTSSAVGSAAGFWLTYRAFANKPERHAALDGEPCVQIMPEGLALALASSGHAGRPRTFPVLAFGF
jgi:hypothetical protein